MNKRSFMCYVASLLAALCLIGLTCPGCGSGVSSEATVGKCRVVVDGQTLHDVRVVLLREGANDVLMEGVSNATGSVELKLAQGAELPGEAALKLKVAVQSLGDWQIIPPWSSPEKTPLLIEWPAGDEETRIELPTRAMRAL